MARLLLIDLTFRTKKISKFLSTHFLPNTTTLNQSDHLNFPAPI